MLDNLEQLTQFTIRIGTIFKKYLKYF